MPQKTNKRNVKRGSLAGQDCFYIGFWAPQELVNQLDTAAKQKDSDRSKLMRMALEEAFTTTPKATV